jgi:hypothetical protein
MRRCLSNNNNNNKNKIPVYLRANVRAWKPTAKLARVKYKQTHKEQGD